MLYDTNTKRHKDIRNKMPQSAKVEVQIDKNSDVQETRTEQEDDDLAKFAAEFDRAANNESDFSPISYEDDEFNVRDAFFENFHAGYKRESEHR